MASPRRWVSPAVVGLALLAPAGAAAAPIDIGASAAANPAKLRAVSSPPRRLLAGSTFTLKATVRNASTRAARPRLVVRLRKFRHAAGGRVVAAKRLSTLRRGRSKRASIVARLPEGLSARRYYLSVCVRLAGRQTCRNAGRVDVTRRSTAPAPRPNTGGSGGGDDDDDDRYDVLVLTESRTATDNHASSSAGISAIRSAARSGGFEVDTASQSAGKFTEESLEGYKTVVFLNTTGNLLSDNEQSAFEHYFQQGGGFIGIHATIGAEPTWPLMNKLLGTRATGAESAPGASTIKVADRVHDASKSLPEYWSHADGYYNFPTTTAANGIVSNQIRGMQHVLATADEKTFTGGTMGHDHPVSWCQDLEGGRAFYTAAGHTASSFSDSNLRKHLAGAIKWTAGLSDPVYSDCGATVLANYKQVKISAPPNLNEPIGFDQLPDGRIIQTARAGQVRLHDPSGGTTTTLANLASTADGFPGLYTQSEDGLYGPAVDNDFATNKWVYLYYSPATVTNVRQSDGSIAPSITTVTANAPTTAASPSAWDPWAGYFQLSRFKFVDAVPGNPAHLDPASEQQIMRVPVNRGACCHVGGDIDFDKAGNLWLVTGDDTPAGGGNSGGFSPHNDMKTNESQTVRVLNATGGTFTLTFNGLTTAPIAFNATAAAIQAALEALYPETGDIVVTGAGNVSTANQTVNFRGQHSQTNVPQLTSDASALTGTTTPTITHATTQEGDWYVAPFVDARRSSMNTNDMRGKVLRIKVAANGSYTSPAGNLFPQTGANVGKTRPEVYAMGFRNPFRIQVDKNNVAYITDYSPDSNVPQDFRGPAGTGRVEVVRKPSNYGWPLCYAPDLPYYRWNFNTSLPLDVTPTPYACGNPTTGAPNDSRWNTGATPDGTVSPGLLTTPPIVQPDLWYSYNDNRVVDPLGTPCFGSYDNADTADRCPQLFPELFTGGVGPHGAAAYDFDPANPSETKFPPYYDGAMVLAEFTQNTMREVRFDSQKKVFKINKFLDCGEALVVTPFPFECDNPMDLQFGADGNFYLLTYGDGFFAANNDAGMYRWEYKKGPEAPRAVLTANPTNGVAPLTVAFSSAGSGDDDPGDSITFAWDFDNNGTVDSTMPNPSHVYTANGVYTARLTVTDSTGKTSSQSTVITVGNTAPTVTINTPVDGDFFEWGQNIPYTVTVTDPQDGVIDCNRVRTTFVLVHDTHGHAQTEIAGCSGVLPTDADDITHGGYLAGGISATYTDNPQGSIPALTTVRQNLIQADTAIAPDPIKRQEVEFAQDHVGTTIGNVGANDVGGGGNRTNIDPGDWIGLNNRFNLVNVDDTITFRYAGGAAGLPAAGQPGVPRVAVEIHADSVDGPLVTTPGSATPGTVVLNSTGTNNNTYTSQTFDVSFTGSRRLFLVFRSVTGGPVTGMGNLNWVGFTGPGAGVPAP